MVDWVGKGARKNEANLLLDGSGRGSAWLPMPPLRVITQNEPNLLMRTRAGGIRGRMPAAVNWELSTDNSLRGCARSGTGILPVRLCGIGILPMVHGLEGDPQRGILRWGPQTHATLNRLLTHPLRFLLPR